MKTDDNGVYFTNDELEQYFRLEADARLYINTLIRKKRVDMILEKRNK